MVRYPVNMRRRHSYGAGFKFTADGTPETDMLIGRHAYAMIDTLRYELSIGQFGNAGRILEDINSVLTDSSYSKYFTAQDMNELRSAHDEILEHSRPLEWGVLPDAKPNLPEAQAHEVLGIRQDAHESEIRSAYKKLAKIHHPDLNGNSKTSTAKFVEIQRAYEEMLRKAQA